VTQAGKSDRFESRATPIRVTRVGDRLEGRADGVDMRQLKRLRRGEIPCDREIDLHGMTAVVARSAVIEAILAACAAGERCLRVVHGRGHRSAGGRAILRDALADWLMDPRVAGEMLAVATDDSPGGGGPGATWVLLRRSRAD
jgi:DNA-nicking Smr family endonuclease